MSWIALPALVAAKDEAQTHLAQARLYMRKQWFDEAAAELEQATQTPAGATNAEVWWLLAQVRYELLDAKGAMDAARTAAGVASDPGEASQAQAYADWIETSFGLVAIAAPQPGVQSRLQLDRESLLLDPELKRFVDRVALEWTHPQPLPMQIMLPSGDYKIQGTPVRAEPSPARPPSLFCRWALLAKPALPRFRSPAWRFPAVLECCWASAWITCVPAGSWSWG